MDRIDMIRHRLISVVEEASVWKQTRNESVTDALRTALILYPIIVLFPQV